MSSVLNCLLPISLTMNGIHKKLRKLAMVLVTRASTYPPCKKIREYILATKAISQIHFISQISAIPVKALQDIQNAIAKALWKNCSKWRSKRLLLGILTKPLRADPFVAPAFRTILDTTSFFQNSTAESRQLWHDQCGADLL